MNAEWAAFARLIATIQPWRDNLVLVGGWAHRLHHEHALAHRPDHAPILTRDADLAFRAGSVATGSLKHALAAAGFREELSGDERPPVAQYRWSEDDSGFYAEFLSPLRGPTTARDGGSRATRAHAGVTTQQLRHLDVLLTAPWAFTVGASGPRPTSRRDASTVFAANPVAFIVQKFLIRDERAPAKRPQDVLYVHDTLQLFAPNLGALRAIWKEQVEPSLTPGERATVQTTRDRLFSRLTDDIRAAVRIAQDRLLTPEAVRATCSLGLEALMAGA